MLRKTQAADSGEPMFNDRTTPLSLLLSRRSGKPRDMVGPGPNAEELDRILGIASRVPDHGKLAPWRFIIIPDEMRDALSQLLTAAYQAEKPEAGRLELEAMDQFARQAPALVVVLSSPVAQSKIPVWEQELSTGAACMQLLNAAHAMGFVGGWLTGWPSYSETVRQAFARGDERIAGFFFLGTPSRPLEERPRPDMAQIVTIWAG